MANATEKKSGKVVVVGDGA